MQDSSCCYMSQNPHAVSHSEHTAVLSENPKRPSPFPSLIQHLFFPQHHIFNFGMESRGLVDPILHSG